MAVTEVSGDRVGRSLLELYGGHMSIQDAVDVARRQRTVRLSDRAADSERSCVSNINLFENRDER